MIRAQFRRGLAAAWTAANPVLLDGELGLESDTGKFKMGNGVTAWTALAYSSGVQGLKGDDGAPGPGYGGTSISSVAIGTGSKTFETQAGLAYLAGDYIRIVNPADTANWMEGQITSYSGTTMVVNVTLSNGTGTLDAWNISLAGVQGQAGIQGPQGGQGIQGIQGDKGDTGSIPISTAGGTVDAIAATFDPAVTLSNLALCAFVASGANTSATPTFAPDGLTARTIVKQGGKALVAGDIPGAGAVCLLEYNLANTRWELLNPAYPIPFGITKDVNRLQNLSIAASVSSKVLTVALKGEDGNDPSAANPVTIAFRDETLATGTPNVRTVTSAKSIALSSGSTLGFTAALAGRIYVWAIDNAGTVELALSRTADIFPESNLVTTTAEGGAGAADSASIMYSTTARSNVACRCIGYIEITSGAVAGEWDNAPTKIQVMGPGVKRTGDVVQVVNYQTGAVATGATVIPFDDSIPQITEGNEFMTLAITPTSALNILDIAVLAWLSVVNAPATVQMALFVGTTADALAAVAFQNSSAYVDTNTLRYRGAAGSISPLTFRVRCGGASGTITFNGQAAGRVYGGAANSSITIMEVMA